MNDIGKTNLLISQINFQLQQLTSNNAHFDFEKICFYLANAKICNHIIPATGPVSSGGDQGVDFESYRCFTGDKEDHFNYLLAAEPVAFACSTATKYQAKIKRDIISINQQSKRFKFVIFFSSQLILTWSTDLIHPS